MIGRLITENFENYVVHLVLDLLINFRGCTHFFFSTTPSSICASSSFFQAHSQCYDQTTSFRVIQHVGYGMIRLQLNYCAKILHRLGRPSNIIMQ